MSIYHKENPQHFDECMQSIWNKQSLRPSQIVLVKDGLLTDELEQIIVIWQKKINSTLKVVPLSKNVGLAMALNEGMKYCDNDWVFRMDADDICASNRFQKQVDFIKQNPEVVLLGGQIQEFNHTIGDLSVIKYVPTDYQKICQLLVWRNPFNHMTVGFKKSVILQLGAYHHHLFMEDYHLWLRVIASGKKVSNLPDELVYARVGNGMHTRRRGLRYLLSEWQLYRLKTSLKLQNPVVGLVFFVLRALPRLLPAILLTKVYQLLRHSPPK